MIPVSSLLLARFSISFVSSIAVKSNFAVFSNIPVTAIIGLDILLLNITAKATANSEAIIIIAIIKYTVVYISANTSGFGTVIISTLPSCILE